MPTEYTVKIIDNPNLTFREFALDCARAFDECQELDLIISGSLILENHLNEALYSS